MTIEIFTYFLRVYQYPYKHNYSYCLLLFIDIYIYIYNRYKLNEAKFSLGISWLYLPKCMANSAYHSLRASSNKSRDYTIKDFTVLFHGFWINRIIFINHTSVPRFRESGNVFTGIWKWQKPKNYQFVSFGTICSYGFARILEGWSPPLSQLLSCPFNHSKHYRCVFYYLFLRTFYLTSCMFEFELLRCDVRIKIEKRNIMKLFNYIWYVYVF